jgi:hypothetical protein
MRFIRPRSVYFFCRTLRSPHCRAVFHTVISLNHPPYFSSPILWSSYPAYRLHPHPFVTSITSRAASSAAYPDPSGSICSMRILSPLDCIYHALRRISTTNRFPLHRMTFTAFATSIAWSSIIRRFVSLIRQELMSHSVASPHACLYRSQLQ